MALPTKKLYMNEILFREGDIGEIAYVVRKGAIEISIESGGGKIVLANLGASAVFGEMAIIFDEERRTATAMATEYTELVQIHKNDFEKFLAKSPKIIVHLLNALVSRLQQTTQRLGKAPNVFLGCCEMINLLSYHNREVIDYDVTVHSMASTFITDNESIKEKLQEMEDNELVDILIDGIGKKTIRIIGRHSFMSRARRAFQKSGGQL